MQKRFNCLKTPYLSISSNNQERLATKEEKRLKVTPMPRQTFLYSSEGRSKRLPGRFYLHDKTTFVHSEVLPLTFLKFVSHLSQSSEKFCPRLLSVLWAHSFPLKIIYYTSKLPTFLYFSPFYEECTI